MSLERVMLAVDPGDVHVGIAEFVQRPGGWVCLRAYEMSHEEGADKITSLIVGGGLDALVVERFALYADKAKSQIGSEMLTSQLIGVIKYIHRHYTDSLKGKFVGPSRRRTQLVFQPASIQKPTLAILRAKEIRSEAKGNAHAKSAELHGHHWALRYGDI